MMMSKTKDELIEDNALLTARAEDAEALLSEASAALESLKEKHRRDVNDYKKKVKSAAKSTDRLRQQAFEAAQEGANELRARAEVMIEDLENTDVSNFGIPAQAEVKAKIEVIRKLFGGL
jgi:hypothetical protein